MEALQTLFRRGNDLLADSIATLETADWTTELGFKYDKNVSEEEFAAFVFIKMRSDILMFCSPERKQKVGEIMQLLTADDLAQVDQFKELTDDAELRAVLSKLTGQRIPDELNQFIKYVRDQTSKIFLPGTTALMFPQNAKITDILTGFRDMQLAKSEDIDSVVEQQKVLKNIEIQAALHESAEQKPVEEINPEYVATHWPGSVYENIYGDIPDEVKYKLLKEASIVALCEKIREKYNLPDLIRELRLLNPAINVNVRQILGTNIEICPDTFEDIPPYLKKMDELNAYIDEMVTTDPYNQMVEVVLSNIEDAKKEKLVAENMVAGVTKLSRLTKARILNGKFNSFFRTMFVNNLTKYKQILTPYFSEVEKSVIFNTSTSEPGKANLKKIVYILNVWPSILADVATVNLLNEEHRKNASGKTDQEQKEELTAAKNIVINKLNDVVRNSRADAKSPSFNLPRFGGKKTRTKRKGTRRRSRKTLFF